MTTAIVPGAEVKQNEKGPSMQVLLAWASLICRKAKATQAGKFSIESSEEVGDEVVLLAKENGKDAIYVYSNGKITQRKSPPVVSISFKTGEAVTIFTAEKIGDVFYLKFEYDGQQKRHRIFGEVSQEALKIMLTAWATHLGFEPIKEEK